MEIITLEDNANYVILDYIIINQVKYVYLVEATESQKKKICIRKLIDKETNLVGLDSNSEYQTALNAYALKYKDLFLDKAFI